MDDPREAIATAEDPDSLRRAYASAIATTGARGDTAEFRRIFLARREDLGAPSAVDEVEESDRAFGRWSLRCFSGEEPETALRTELDAAFSSYGERDRRRFARVLDAHDDWLAAREDPKVADALLRGFLARLTGAAAGKAPAGSEKSVRRLQKLYGRVYAIDPDWFETATVSGTSPAGNFFRRYAIWFVLAGIARLVFKVMSMIDGDAP
jgi:hypothetical protein